MRNLFKSTFIIFTLLFLSFVGISQKANKPFKVLDTDQGLQMRVIYQIADDEFGYRWFCGRGGLVKYDGSNYRYYTNDALDSTSISNDVTTSFLETSDKKYLVGSQGGFSILNRKTGLFENFRHNVQDSLSINSNQVWDIVEDKNGNIYVSTGSGVNQFHPDTKTFSRFNNSRDYNSTTKRTTLAIDDLNNIWFSSPSGLYKVNRDDLNLNKVDLSKYPELDLGINSLVIIDSQIYLGSTKGLFTYDIKTGYLEKIKIGKELNQLNVYALAIDKDSILYLGSRMNGLYKWNLKSGQLVDQYQYNPLDLKGISSNQIFSLFVDSKLIWIGTRDGVNITEKEENKGMVYPIEPGPKNPNNLVIKIFSDRNSNIWFVTHKGLLRKKNLSSEPVNISLANQKEKSFMCKDITEDKLGNIWVLNLSSKNLMKCESDVLHNVESYSFFKNAQINEIEFDQYSNDVLLLCTSKGLCRYNVDSRDTVWVYPTLLSNKAQSNSVRHIIQESPTKYWFINDQNLCAYYSLLDSLDYTDTNPKDSLALKSTSISSMTLDADNVYLTGNAGLGIYSKKEKRFYNHGPEDSVVLTPLAGVIPGDDGRIWFVGGGNFGHYNPRNNYLEYNKKHQETGGNVGGAISKTPEGIILGGTRFGILAFHPNEIVKDTTNPKMVLSKVSLFGIEKKFEEEVEYIKNIELSYKESRMFTVDFSPLQFLGLEYFKYEYKVGGATETWMSLGQDRDLICRDWAPGVYNFSFRSTNPDGVKSKENLAFTIQINKPFYQTWWFYSAIALAALTIIYLLFLNRKKRIQLKAEKELAEKNAHYKTKFLSNMSHEIRTPMNGIMGLNKLMMDSKLDKKQKKYTDAINVSCENLLWIINDILDQAKIESGKFSLKEEPFELRSIVEQVGTLLSHKIEEKDLQLNIDIDETVPEILLGDGTRLFQVITNLVGNSIKFTEKGAINISVNSDYSLEEDSHNVQFEVHDTGIGIPKEKLSTIFHSFEQLEDQNTGQSYAPQGTGLGLTIAKEIVELQNGTIRVDSKAGEGTTFYFAIPFKKGVRKISYNQEDLIKDLPDGIRILLVEDNQINQFLASELLKKNLVDVKIDVADNGEIALEKIESKNYDLVLMDVQMPIMGGKEATRAIRAHADDYFKNVPILGLTASAINEELKDCLNSGMNDYTTKPIDTNELFMKIKLLINDKY